jgi:hypothetical protein
MLSLASNISATQAVEAKYSASFDGTNDYIDTGQNFSSVFNDSFTISFWAKPDDGQPASTQYFFGENDSDDDILRGQLETDGDFRLLLEGNTATGFFRTNSPVFSDGAATSWTHILVSVTKPGSGDSTAVIYINGSSVAITTQDIPHDDHAAFSSAQNLAIGARNNKGTIMSFYSGGMDEWALWNVALDADAAAAIYNGGSPLNLKFNQGNYDNSSALQVYYRMGDGFFDDINNPISTSSEQGIIVDQSGTVTIDADQSVAINTTNWEVSHDDFNGQTPIGDGVITVDGTQTDFSSIRPKSAVYNNTIVGEFYRVEVHYTRSAGTVQLKAAGDESTNSGISLSAGSDISVQQIGVGYIKATNANWGLTFSSSFVGTVTKVILQKITPNTSGIVKNGATRSDDTP